MFSRRERLPRAQFPAALAGRRKNSTHFSAATSPDARGYAVVIPKKVIRLASARHRAKRQILEALRTFPLPQSLIIFVRTPLQSMNYEDIRVELEGLLSAIRT